MTTEPGILNLVVQGGSFALLAWVFVYWLPRIVTSVNSELQLNRAAVSMLSIENRVALDKVVERTLLERKEDRESRHALADKFSVSLMQIFLENSKQTEKVTNAICSQTDKLTAKLDVVVIGLLKGNLEAAEKLKYETDLKA